MSRHNSNRLWRKFMTYRSALASPTNPDLRSQNAEIRGRYADLQRAESMCGCKYMQRS